MEQNSRQRIDALDALRGIAILGILLLNISGFALLRVASFNPMHSGEATFADKLTWMGLNLFTQGKFLFIFALLFGGTLYLLSQRSVAWNVSRLIILALIGIIHTLLLWEGDILFPYSICGLFVLFFIKALPIKRQFILGLLLYLFGAIILAFLFYYYRDFVEIVWYSSDYSAMIETNWKTGNYINSIYWRLDELSDFIFNLVRQYSWFLIGAMLMGAALMASGWLQRRYSQSHYGLIAVCFFSHKFTFPRDACYYRLLFRLALYVVCGSGSAYHHGDPNYSKLRLYCFTLLGMALYSTQFYRLCFTLCGENGAYHLFTTEYYWHNAFPADGVI